MSHPKNNTASAFAQYAVTVETAYKACHGADDETLQVRGGIDVIDALEDSSCRLSEVLLFIREYLDEDAGLKISAVYLLQEQLMNAKAVLDSSVAGLMHARLVGGGK